MKREIKSAQKDCEYKMEFTAVRSERNDCTLHGWGFRVAKLGKKR